MKCMKQVFHFVRKAGQEFLRRPLAEGQKYEPFHCFGPWESRQFLEISRLERFGLVSSDDLAQALHMLRYGLIIDGHRWHATGVGSFVRDTGAQLLMLPEPVDDAIVSRLLGLEIPLVRPNDAFKAGKYVKRLLAHHHGGFGRGQVLEVTDHGHHANMRVRWGETELRVKYEAGHGALTDGMHLMSRDGARKLLKRRVPAGSGFMITALSPLGFSKGHVIVVDDLLYDLVLFDSKTLLTGEGFSFGVLNQLHPGELFTDVQSVINFRLEPFLAEWAEAFMAEVFRSAHDETGIRRLLGIYRLDNVDQDPILAANSWTLTRALLSGIAFVGIPGLQRKVMRLLFHQVLDCDGQVRVPVPAAVGHRRYMIVDPRLFDRAGEPDPARSQLRGNQVVLPGVAGSAVLHRQPNGNPNEHWRTQSVASLWHEKLDTGAFVFLGPEMISEAMARMGGGDQDDAAVCYHDPLVVRHFEQLEAYPESRVEKRPEIAPAPNRFLGLLPRPRPLYDRDTVATMLFQYENLRTGIGQFVNPVMVDTMISRDREEILSDLDPKDPRQLEALDKLEAAEPYQLRTLASGFEDLIDAIKRDGSDITQVNNTLRAFWQWLPVIPRFCLRGGWDGQGRLPASRRGEQAPLSVETTVDRVLDQIVEARTELEEAFRLSEWQHLADIPEEILTYPSPTEDENRHLARAIRSFYLRHLIDSLRAVEQDDKEKDKERARIEVFKRVDQLVYVTFKDHPLILDAMLELWQLIYSQRQLEPPRDAQGRVKSFPDGLLWGHAMSNLTLAALEQAGLTGLYRAVNFEHEYRHYRREIVDVRVLKTVCWIQGTSVKVGTIDVPDGHYQMEHGFIRAQNFTVRARPTPLDLTVVAGWASRAHTVAEIVEWRSHVNEQVELVPTEYEGEYAVEVQLGGRHFGWIPREENYLVTRAMGGHLAPGHTPKTLRVWLALEEADVEALEK